MELPFAIGMYLHANMFKLNINVRYQKGGTKLFYKGDILFLLALFVLYFSSHDMMHHSNSAQVHNSTRQIYSKEHSHLWQLLFTAIWYYNYPFYWRGRLHEIYFCYHNTQ